MIPDDHTDRAPRCWRRLGEWRCDENAIPGSSYCAEHLIERHQHERTNTR